MNLFDPARPVLPNGVYCYINPRTGKAIAAVPSLNVTVLKNNLIKISVMLMVSFNSAKWYDYILSIKELQFFLEEWEKDLEETLGKHFKYEFTDFKKPEFLEVSLSDLGI